MSNNSILVCGTGIAGLACAAALARAGERVTLLGPRPRLPLPQPDAYFPRVYAISGASRALLERLGVWQALPPERITPVQTMDIHGDASGRLVLDAWQAASDTLAWILESSEIERALQQAVGMLGVEWITDNFTDFDGAKVRTDSGRTFEAGLVVGADGAKSRVRAAAGIAHRARAYGHTGLVAHLNIEWPHQGIAHQWFTGDSVLALLPMPDTADGPQVSMVWSLPSSQAERWLALDADERKQALPRALRGITGSTFGALQLRSAVHGFPLSIEATDLIGGRVALVGDAAHRVHPLAGQGLNLGLGDVDALVQCVQGREAFRPVGDARVLERYRRLRREPVLTMGAVTDGLQRLFGWQAPPAVMARNLGMLAIDRLPGVKRLLVQAARGSSPRHP